MKNNSFFLVLVESPSKCKKIQNILNNHYKNKYFKVKATIGHIRDLKKKELGIDINNNFKGSFQIIPKKNGLINQLRTDIHNAEQVYLGMDNDREGMRIAYDVTKVFHIKNPLRIIFTEITKDAIIHAIENPTSINMNIVHAQMCRRYLDRLIGFTLSPIVRKHISALSAGRCQSVITKMIIEREKKINNENQKNYYELFALFKNKLNGKSNKIFESKELCIEYLNKIKNYTYYIKNITCEIKEKHPPPPFITSTVQQSCIQKFKYNTQTITKHLQQLYQKGLITYIRTDSTKISNTFINTLHKYIETVFGKEHKHFRQYSSKIKGAQLAHECIRITNPQYNYNLINDKIQKNIYTEILKRTLSTQMTPKKYKEQIVLIGCKEDNTLEFKCINELVLQNGWVTLYEKNNKFKKKLNEYTLDTILDYNKIECKYKENIPIQRYNEALLIKELEKNGIGRPSTYSSLIQMIMKRGYIEKKSNQGEKKIIYNVILQNDKIKEHKLTKVFGKYSQRLVPTILGKNIVDFLDKNINYMMDYNYTSKIEDELDSISLGKLNWKEQLKSHYELLQSNIKNINYIKNNKMLVKILKFKGISYELRMNNYGYVLVSENDKIYITEEIDPNNSKTFKHYFPRYFNYDNKQGKIIYGRYGYYMMYDGKNINVKYYCSKNNKNPFELTMDDYEHIIQSQKNKNKCLGKVNNEPLYLCDGKYGMYFKYKNKNKSIKSILKDLNKSIDELTNDDLVNIVSNF